MKKSDKQKAETLMGKIRAIARHRRNVEDNCLLLGERLIYAGEFELGKQVIANGGVHDVSKYSGIEFEFMAPGTPTEEETAKLKLKIAIQQHNTTNKHHPEAWSGGIKDMPDVYLAELVCDCKARSEEQASDFREWIDTVATKKWNFTAEDEVYQKIMKYINILCEQPFKAVE